MRNNITRYIIIGISLLVIGYLIYTFSTIVAYVVIAWVLSMLGQPLMRFFQHYFRLEKFKFGKSVSALLTILCFFIILVGILMLFVPLVVQEARALSGLNYDAISQSLEQPLNNIQQWLVNVGVTDEVKPPPQLVQDALANIFTVGSLGAFFSSSLNTVASILAGFASVVFITFFFLRDQGMFTNFIVTLAPQHYEQRIRHTMHDISILLTRYFGGVVLQVSWITIYVSILLSIFGIKNAILIGFFAGVMNLIPYLGPTLGGALGVLIAVSSNLDADFNTVLLPITLKVIGVFVTAQWLDNNFVTPLIYSTSVMAHPLEIFLVILIAAQIGGIVGMVLAIPAYTVLRVIAREFLNQFRLVQKLTERMEEEMEEHPPGSGSLGDNEAQEAHVPNNVIKTD